MWVQFVVGSCPFSEVFFFNPGCLVFLPPQIPNWPGNSGWKSHCGSYLNFHTYELSPRSILKVTDQDFSCWFMAQARSTQAINQWEKRGSVTYSADRENNFSKIFIISLRLIECTGNLAGCTVKYGPQNWLITLRVITERQNKFVWLTLFLIPFNFFLSSFSPTASLNIVSP